MALRWSPVFLIVVVALLVSSVWGRSAPVAQSRNVLRIATFNIHKGADRQDHYDLERTIQAIASLDVDLIGTQEVLRNHAGFACADQPALIEQGLRRLTGRAWSHVYVSTQKNGSRICLASGRGDSTETEGLAFFAPERLIASRSVDLPEARAGLAVRLASMPGVSVVVTHLTASRQNQAHRVGQLALLLPWVETLGPSVLIGDFNARPDAEELVPVHARYLDAWDVANARGLAGGAVADPGRPRRRRIDYVFYDPGLAWTLESVDEVHTASPPDRGEVSDHRPVVATFRRNTTKS